MKTKENSTDAVNDAIGTAHPNGPKDREENRHTTLRTDVNIVCITKVVGNH